MGYELHICRSVSHSHSLRYPISAAEVEALVQRSPDLGFTDDRQAITVAGTDRVLHFWENSLEAKHPPDHLIRRMVAIGEELDAWVTGDEGEIYSWNGQEIETRDPDEDDEPGEGAAWITRGCAAAGRNDFAPIVEAEWLAFAAELDGFEVRSEIGARLPSGPRPIPCPPIAIWTGHPSGEPVPFWFDEDLLEIDVLDEPTLRCMLLVAAGLDAEVQDRDDQQLTV
ncbi:hypothetical protein [Actinoplanes palleronii]|uniref:hypothetical protein n=1 Tax=Actinoplanes palleronii TaxID=113570 RepID=UPI0019458FF0|nr:hypothetical protein [Actinoplanes palleronii]